MNDNDRTWIERARQQIAKCDRDVSFLSEAAERFRDYTFYPNGANDLIEDTEAEPVLRVIQSAAAIIRRRRTRIEKAMESAPCYVEMLRETGMDWIIPGNSPE
jgi:hypothetical protein